MKFVFLVLLQFVFASAPQMEKVMDGFDIIWAMDFVDEETILLNQRSGEMFLVDLKNKKKIVIQGVPKTYQGGQGGLLDVKLHPDFKKNKWVYFTYSITEKGKHTTRLSRAQLEGTQLTNLETLFTAMPFQDDDIHFGSRIAFDGKGHVFLTVGDRNERFLAQDMNTHMGKVIRIKENGTAPEIWSYGHRNPQGIFYDKQKNQLWVSEHGPRGGDEINLSEKGKNYGWPIITYGREYWGPKIGEGTMKAGMEQPVKMYNPSIAPSSLIIYQGDKYGWKGRFIQGALKLQHLNVVKIENGKASDEKRFFEKKDLRIRSLAESPSGTLFFGTDAGEIFRINMRE